MRRILKDYDKAFRDDELEVAKAVDKPKDFVWGILDYGIPLIKSGTSSVFYPDFLWWVKDTVWAIGPTGWFILMEKVRTKLTSVPPPLKIALFKRGQLSSSYVRLSDEGWSLLRFRTGNAARETFDSIDDVTPLISESSFSVPNTKSFLSFITLSKKGLPATSFDRNSDTGKTVGLISRPSAF